MAAKTSINPAAIFYSIAKEIFCSPIAVRIRRDRPAPGRLLQEIDRVMSMRSELPIAR